MVLKSTSASDVSVYQVSGSALSRSLPDWIAKKRKRSLKNDVDYQTRVELIQDFEFSEASNKIKVTPDGNFAMATGTYKPQIHVYDFANLSLKFDRHTDAENVDFLILSDDWTKSVHLQCDRSIQFQSKGGMHYQARIPKFGRSLAYNPVNCDLYVGASGDELYRLNLEQGRFLNPFKLESEGVNHVDISKTSGLLSVCMEDNVVEFWDPRARSRVAKLAVAGTGGVTTSAFHADGLNFACGTGDGMSYLWDLRSSEPYQSKDQGYGEPLKKLIWCGRDKILSCDKRIAKIWDTQSGKAFASMEPSVDINDITRVGDDSGMFFMANEGIAMHTYYIPQLGPAPRWCSFLDSITEELEEKPAESVYSNYRFITKADVAKLNLAHLVGSKVMRPYMHGYFINTELYDKVMLIANPDLIRDQREREIKKRIEKERESRIRSTGATKVTKAKVNKPLVEKLAAKRGSELANKVLEDDRFKEMFEDADFEVDTENYDYKQLNPVASANAVEAKRARALTAAEESDEERLNDNKSESESESESEEESEKEELTEKEKKQIAKQIATIKKRKQEARETDRFLTSMTVGAAQSTSQQNKTFGEKVKRLPKKQVRKNTDDVMRKNARGEVELTFVPKKKEKTKRVQFNEDHDESLSGRTRARNDGRRASKNAFRGM